MRSQGKTEESAKKICGKLQAEAEKGNTKHAHIWMPIHYDKKTRKIQAILTNDSIDRDEERMSSSLINAYYKQVKETGHLPMLMDHENKIDSFTGIWKNPRLINENNQAALVMEPAFFSAEANPRSSQLKKMIEEASDMGAGIGVSIGARPLASHEAREDGKSVIIWDEAELLEASYTPIPSNRFAFTNIAKKFKTNIFGVAIGKTTGEAMKKQKEDEVEVTPPSEEEVKQEDEANGEAVLMELLNEVVSKVEAQETRIKELEGAVFEAEAEEEITEAEEEEEDMEKVVDEEDEETKAAEDNDQEPIEPHEDTGEAANDDGVGVLEEGSTATPGEIVDDEDNPKEEGTVAPGSTKPKKKTTLASLKKKVKELEKQMKEPVYKPLEPTGGETQSSRSVYNANKAVQLLTSR